MKLNSSQKKAVEGLGENRLIVAGPGSGKTLVLSKRYEYLVDEGIKPENILLTAFNREAAEEFQERIDIDFDKHNSHVGTLHSIGRRIVRDNYKEVGFDKKPKTLTGYHRKKFAEKVGKKTVKKFTRQDNPNRGLVDDVVDVGLRNVDRNRRLLNEPEEAEEDIGFMTEEQKSKMNTGFGRVKEIFSNGGFEYFYREYNKKQMKGDRIDYSAMLYLTLEVFQEDKDVRKKYDEKFEHILVDECQDLNRLQYNIFKELCKDAGNVFMVGDSSQSIYKFRGSEIQILEDFVEDFDAEEILLDTNYRCSPEITNAINKINDGMREVRKKLLYSDRNSNENTVGFPKIKHAGPAKVADLVAKNIRETYDPSQIAILARTNRTLYDYQKQLEMKGVPTRNTKTNFIELNDVRGAYGYARALEQKDGPAMEALLKWRHVYNIEEIKKNVPSDNNLYEFVKDLNLNNDFIPKKKIQKLRRDFDYIEKLDENDPIGDFIETKLSGYTDNVEALNDLYHSMGKEKFFDYMEIDREDKGVTLSTVHSAKGKEWPVVFVVEVDDGKFPRDDDPEEERVFYVAVSRAADRLYLSYNDEGSHFLNMIAK